MEYNACAGAENKFRIDLTCNVHVCVCVSVSRHAKCFSFVRVRTSVLYMSVLCTRFNFRNNASVQYVYVLYV